MQYSTSKYEMLKSLNQSGSEIRVRSAKGRVASHPYKIAYDCAEQSAATLPARFEKVCRLRFCHVSIATPMLAKQFDFRTRQAQSAKQ